MKSFLKFILWVAVLGGVVYGGFYAYDNWWKADGGKAIREEAGQKLGDYAKSVASTTKETAASFLKDKLGDFIANVGEEIVSAGLNLSGATSAVPFYSPVPNSPTVLPVGSVPAPTSSAFDAPPPPATIVVKTGESISFSINSGQTYKIDWGDNVKDQGATEAGKTTIVNHTWKAEGDYTVNVSVGTSVSTNVFSFPVRVYE
jgi:hypothetical protein